MLSVVSSVPVTLQKTLLEVKEMGQIIFKDKAKKLHLDNSSVRTTRLVTIRSSN